jgi:hypothetical protein
MCDRCLLFPNRPPVGAAVGRARGGNAFAATNALSGAVAKLLPRKQIRSNEAVAGRTSGTSCLRR